MHRLIMTSEAYQMTSQYDGPGDPENRYLWRFPIQRLDAEIVRDAILAASGALNLTMGGPPVFPHLQTKILGSMHEGIWKRQEDGPAVWRRSVYVYRRRGLPFPPVRGVRPAGPEQQLQPPECVDRAHKFCRNGTGCVQQFIS